MNENKIIVINRLREDKPGRDDTDSGYLADTSLTWTVDIIREKAGVLGKKFSPDEKTLEQLTADLKDGAVVLFTTYDVAEAYEAGLIGLFDVPDYLVVVSARENNDIAVIPLEDIERQVKSGELSEPDKLRRWLLFNSQR